MRENRPERRAKPPLLQFGSGAAPKRQRARHLCRAPRAPLRAICDQLAYFRKALKKRAAGQARKARRAGPEPSRQESSVPSIPHSSGARSSPSRWSRWSRWSRAATRLEPPLKGSGRGALDMCLAAADLVATLAHFASPSEPERDHRDHQDNRDGAGGPRRPIRSRAGSGGWRGGA